MEIDYIGDDGEIRLAPDDERRLRNWYNFAQVFGKGPHVVKWIPWLWNRRN